MAAALAGSAVGQEAADPIGALLDAPAPPAPATPTAAPPETVTADPVAASPAPSAVEAPAPAAPSAAMPVPAPASAPAPTAAEPAPVQAASPTSPAPSSVATSSAPDPAAAPYTPAPAAPAVSRPPQTHGSATTYPPPSATYAPAPYATSAPSGLPPSNAPSSAYSPAPTYTPYVPSPPAYRPSAPYSAPTVATAPAPQIYRRPQITEPVHIDEVGKTPERFTSAMDAVYDSRLRASFASAQGMQGPLDGSWTLSAEDKDLYSFELVDRNGGYLEGAWRDLRRIGALGASGFVSEVSRYGPQLTMRFSSATATLSAGVDGRWSGELVDKGGQRSTVVLRRN